MIKLIKFIIPLISITLFSCGNTTLYNTSKISLGFGHTAVIKPEGSVFIWGENSNYALGDGTDVNKNTPQNITSRFLLSGNEKVTQISTGGEHSSALTSKGRVFMWGLNHNFQLGIGTFNPQSTPLDLTLSFPISNNDKIKHISLGYDHSSALSNLGRLFVWGSNTDGKLGDGTFSSERTTPHEITTFFPLNNTDKLSSVKLGQYHSAGLSESGRVFIWGLNYSGLLGDGTFTSRKTPTEITSLFQLPNDDKIVQISLGELHSSALSSEGRVYTWGSNDYGQLGNGTNIDSNLPIEISNKFSLSNGEKISLLSLGAVHSSAITTSGRIFVWGSNEYSVLGDGTYINRNLPVEITFRFSLLNNEQIEVISMGSYHSSAVTSKGNIFMWGENWSGQLGNGSNQNINFPNKVIF